MTPRLVRAGNDPKPLAYQLQRGDFWAAHRTPRDPQQEDDVPMIRRTLVASLAALTLLLGVTVSLAAAARPVWVFQTVLTGEAEVPGPGDADAIGQATIMIFPDSDTICWAVSWALVDGTVVASHIHGTATTTEFANVVVPLFVGATFEGQGSDTGCIVDSDADAIVANPELYYVNVHSTPSFGAGAIRGQLA
jgi:hypothetical protein